MSRAAKILGDIAERREREQASKAKREKRIDELAEELWKLFNPGWALVERDVVRFQTAARKLLEHYPALAAGPAEENDHG